MFKTILWATDGSEAADRALLFARMLAAGAGKELVVVHCKEILTGRAGGYPRLADEDELRAKILGQIEQLRGEGFTVMRRFITGGPTSAASSIAELAGEVGADVIVVGTRGHSPLGELLGSVTRRLLQIAPCPVLGVPAGKKAPVHEPVREAVGVAP